PRLLLTIFYPGTPLHDGAVVIRGREIIAAECVLPLSDNPRISSSLHTRHRAALGLAERTDAAVLVVSEETGNISLAYDGRLLTALSPEVVRDKLFGLLQQNEASGRAVRRARREGSAPGGEPAEATGAPENEGRRPLEVAAAFLDALSDIGRRVPGSKRRVVEKEESR
ncbi:MAG: diadenylate cyclase, partial [Armatimonadota bacterium]|nr:diadenylate cyclase [Armatimonadota bacterium]